MASRRPVRRRGRAPVGARPVDPLLGSTLRLRIEGVAHGGHCVARHDGRVVFVRHTLPGELVDAVVTGAGGGGRFLRADAVDVLEPAAGRRPPPCPASGPGGCGGCDWQHVEPGEQRRLKAAVVRDVLARIGRQRGDWLDGLQVEAVAGDRDGLAWRTRVAFAVDPDGRAGLRRHRSHDVVPLARCPLATDEVDALDVPGRAWPGCEQVLAVVSGDGDRAVAVTPAPGGRAAPAWAAGLPADVAVVGLRGPRRVHETVLGRGYVVDATGFWQVHPGAAAALVSAVREGLRPAPGERVLDLYSGAGLLAVALADDVGPDGQVDAVEADPAAVGSARRNAHGMPQLRLHESDVAAWWRARGGDDPRPDLVVLDPPRSGAGPAVVAAVAGCGARAAAYVACDPAALARDLASFADLGWPVSSLRVLDLFPTTHHVECVAVLRPA